MKKLLPLQLRENLYRAQLTEDLRNIGTWCCKNSLLINPDKNKTSGSGDSEVADEDTR